MAWGICRNSGGGMNSTLLWTNPSPESASGFAAQDIIADLSEYDYISILAWYSYDHAEKYQETIIKNVNGFVAVIAVNQFQIAGITPTYDVIRPAKILNDRITFGEGYQVAGSGGNLVAIPYKIRGIKGKIRT